jgi:hypothetical protein
MESRIQKYGGADYRFRERGVFDIYCFAESRYIEFWIELLYSYFSGAWVSNCYEV